MNDPRESVERIVAELLVAEELELDEIVAEHVADLDRQALEELRRERDPDIAPESELELRAAWGDR